MRISLALALIFGLTVQLRAGANFTAASSQEVSITDDSALEQVNFTVCYRAAYTGDYRGGIVKNANSGNYTPWQLVAASDGSIIYFLTSTNCGAWGVVLSTSPPPAGSVNTYCASNLSGGTAKLYFNGRVMASGSGTTSICNSNEPVRIARSNAGGAQYWNGTWYEAVYWTGQKSDDFILDWHNSGGRKRYFGADTPIFHYFFADGYPGTITGGVCRDITGNGRNGTWTNSPTWTADPIGYP